MIKMWQIILRICRIIFNINSIFLAIKSKEIAFQDHADALQQAGVNSLALEDVIHIGAVAVQLLCEPTHTALLAQQLSLDFFSDVY